MKERTFFVQSLPSTLRRKYMIQSRKKDPLGQWQFVSPQRNPLLQRHPVLAPLVLFASAVVLAMASFFVDKLFPVLSFIGMPSALACVLFAAVLGLCGVLVCITGFLDLCNTIAQGQIQLALAPQSKGQHHDCN